MTELKTGGAQGYLRIATEEAFITPQVLAAYERLVAEGFDDPGFISLWGFYSKSPSARGIQIRDGLLSLGEKRLADMDAAGIDKAIIALTAPGTHVFQRDEAVALTTDANDQLADACRRHPDRFVGMTAIAPVDPAWSAREIERGHKLGFKAVILNGHVNGEYTDDQKFWPIFEAAEALGTPVYLHPQGPSKGMIQPLVERGLDGAVYGFGVDTGLHLLRLIVMGLFDRFPKLKLIVGHGGEALPYWSYRLDYMHKAGVDSNRHDFL
ncbi:MAG TPA: amidohydrolase family protein, partial [Sphingomonadaceae bacterium]|nr:amidohydrolase family protein [Sphingomonadaceae bacterium]